MRRNVYWSLGNTVVNNILLFLFSIVIGNLLSITDMGYYASAYLMITFSSLVLLGIDSSLIQKLNANSDNNLTKNLYFTVGVIFSALFSLVCLLALFFGQNIFSELFKIDRTGIYLLTSFFFSMEVLLLFIKSVSYADSKFKFITITETLGLTAQLVITIILLKGGQGIHGVFIAMYARLLLSLLMYGLYSFRKYKLVLSKHLIIAGKDLIKFSLLLHVGTIAVFLDQNISSFFVNYYLPKESVAIFFYARKIALLLLALGTSVSNVMYPHLTMLFSKKEHADINMLFSKTTNIFFCIVSIAGITACFNLEWIIKLILPEAYSPVTTISSIILAGLILKALLAPFGTAITSAGMPKYSTITNWISLVISTILSVAIIPVYGLMGAAIVTATTFAINPLLFLWLLKNRLNITYPYKKLLINVFMLICILSIGTFGLKNLVIRELLVVFTGLCIYKYFLTKEDRSFLRERVSNARKMIKFF